MYRRTCTNPRLLRNALSTAAAALLAYRFIRAANQSLADLIASVGTAATLIGALAFGALVRIRQLRERAETAEAKVIQMDEAVLSDDEDKALWDSIPAAKIDEDTCAFGLNVVVLNQHRFPRAG